MSRPFREVILFDNVQGNSGRLMVNNTTNYVLKNSTINVIWRGSIDKFKNDFEIPIDAPLSTKDTGLSTGGSGRFVSEWDWTTLNFKFTYHIWYRDNQITNTDNYYVNGSNNTIYLTIPNVLLFNGSNSFQSGIYYANSSGATSRDYNPNIFPLPISVTTFVTSNKTNDFQAVTGYSTDSLCYLVFRYGVNGSDIEICLLTKNSNAFQVNTQPLIIPYASLTFTGFNKIKRLAGARDDI